MYVMLSRERSREILRRITAGERAGVTLAVWEASRSYAQYNTGEIEATREQIAELAGTTPREVSRALSRLTEIKALVRRARGKYALHPASAWAGSLQARELALFAPAE